MSLLAIITMGLIVASAIAVCIEFRNLKKKDGAQQLALRAVKDLMKEGFDGLKETSNIQTEINKALNDKISKLYTQNLALEDRVLQLDLKKVDKKIVKKKVTKKKATKKVAKKKVAKKKVAKKATKK